MAGVNDAAPLSDLRKEVLRVMDAVEEAGLLLKVIGGLAVYLICPSARRPPLERSYKDLDLVGRAEDARHIEALLESLGYRPDHEFNRLHGHQRLFFWDAENQRQLDVFIDRFSMCHALDFRGRLTEFGRTLPPADLLLTKLQVVEINEKDLKDAAALLADLPLEPDGIDPARIVAILSRDWGWWRTATESLEKVAGYATGLSNFEGASVVKERMHSLRDLIDASPKSFKWKTRARVGERVRWYELPEEIEG